MDITANYTTQQNSDNALQQMINNQPNITAIFDNNMVRALDYPKQTNSQQ